MSATISQNWLEGFKTNLKCGPFPSKTSNPQAEMLTGLVGIEIENLLCACPDALDSDVSSPNIEDTNKDFLKFWYDKIKCGELFESDAQAFAVLAMVKNKALECCTANATEAAAEAAAIVKTVTDPAADTYTAVAEDFDNPPVGETLLVSNADPVDVILPLNATIPVAVGTKLKVIQTGAGAVTVDVEGAGTITGTFVTTGSNDTLLIEKIGTDAWHSALIVA